MGAAVGGLRGGLAVRFGGRAEVLAGGAAVLAELPPGPGGQAGSGRRTGISTEKVPARPGVRMASGAMGPPSSRTSCPG